MVTFIDIYCTLNLWESNHRDTPAGHNNINKEGYFYKLLSSHRASQYLRNYYKPVGKWGVLVVIDQHKRLFQVKDSLWLGIISTATLKELLHESSEKKKQAVSGERKVLCTHIPSVCNSLPHSKNNFQLFLYIVKLL